MQKEKNNQSIYFIALPKIIWLNLAKIAISCYFGASKPLFSRRPKDENIPNFMVWSCVNIMNKHSNFPRTIV